MIDKCISFVRVTKFKSYKFFEKSKVCPQPDFFVNRDRWSVIGDSSHDVDVAEDLIDDASVDGSAASTALERQHRRRRDQSTITDLSQSTNLPEIEIVSLLSEDLPRYKLRAGEHYPQSAVFLV